MLVSKPQKKYYSLAKSNYELSPSERVDFTSETSKRRERIKKPILKRRLLQQGLRIIKTNPLQSLRDSFPKGEALMRKKHCGGI